MTVSNKTSATTVDLYSNVGLRTDIESASPHRLILMLLDGAVDKIRGAKVALERNDIATKGASVSWAISIVDGLRASLDLKQGGEMAENLDRLYDYINRKLLQGNLENEPALFDEALKLLSEIRGAWVEIRPQVEAGAATAANNDLGSVAHAIG